MALLTFLLLAFLVAANAKKTVLNLDNEWEGFKGQFSKTYMNDDEVDRRQIWEDNVNYINSHNEEEQANGKHGYTLQITSNADLSDAEMQTKFTVLPRAEVTLQVRPNGTYKAPKDLDLPVSVNWVEQGVVTRVKDQGPCYSSYAFATACVIESHHAIKTKNLVPLSEQNIVDCATFGGNEGCHGGSIDSSLEYVFLNGGIDTERSYPYEKKAGVCRYKSENSGATINGYMLVEPGNENALKAAVFEKGPIATLIDAQRSFFHYGKGILSGRDCSKVMLNHAVVIVGYGTENGKDYWLAKNSWGVEWGQKGYFRISRNQDNACGIATEACYPLV